MTSTCYEHGCNISIALRRRQKNISTGAVEKVLLAAIMKPMPSSYSANPYQYGAMTKNASANVQVVWSTASANLSLGDLSGIFRNLTI